MGCKRVLAAKDGRDALEVFERESINLLITDVRMPVMDGVSLVRRLAETQVSLPSIVFVSGFGDVDTKEMYALGVEAFISKPFDRAELMRALERALAERASLWLEPMDVVPRQSMVIELDEVSESLEEGRICLGRGGFSARYVGSLSLSKVAFECRLPSGEDVMSGQGYVRWISREEGTVGVEFAFLNEPCRAWVLGEIAATSPQGFIPRCAKREAQEERVVKRAASPEGPSAWAG